MREKKISSKVRREQQPLRGKVKHNAKEEDENMYYTNANKKYVLALIYKP
jgi:hypothetical protein